jgi:DNA-binding NtrC family response regulator
MNMPGMDGVEVLKEIRKRDTNIGVIMVTVVSDRERARSTLELGAFDYITKPVDLNYLETVVLVKAVDLQC